MNPYEAALDGSEPDDAIYSEPAPAFNGPEPWEDGYDEHRAEPGSGPWLAETTRRWMRLGEHAARLRTTCIDAGLGEVLTAYLVGAYLDATCAHAIP